MSSKTREPSCDCIESTNKALVEQGLELPLVFSLSGTRPTTVEIRLSWLDDSTAAKRKRRGRSAPVMLAAFCPFCGVRYGWKDEQPVSSEVAS